MKIRSTTEGAEKLVIVSVCVCAFETAQSDPRELTWFGNLGPLNSSADLALGKSCCPNYCYRCVAQTKCSDQCWQRWISQLLFLSSLRMKFQLLARSFDASRCCVAARPSTTISVTIYPSGIAPPNKKMTMLSLATRSGIIFLASNRFAATSSLKSVRRTSLEMQPLPSSSAHQHATAAVVLTASLLGICPHQSNLPLTLRPFSSPDVPHSKMILSDSLPSLSVLR